MDTSKLHSIIVNALVVKDGKILVSQRSFEEKHEPGKWTIPGGKIEKTEGDVFGVVEKTLAREVMEETGVTITENVVPAVNNTFIRSDGTHVIALTYVCYWELGEPQALEDTIDVKWISEEEIENFEFAPNVELYLRAGFKAA